MVHATEAFATSSSSRGSLPQSKMSAIFMVIADIVGKQPFQVPLVERDHMIQEVSAAAFDPPLSNSILPRALPRSAPTLDFHRANRSGNVHPILGVTIKDEEARAAVIGKSLAAVERSSRSSDVALR